VARQVQVAIDCENPDRLARFWAEVLGYPPPSPPDRDSSEPGEAWSRLTDPDGVRPSVLFHRVPEPKTVKNRVHLDIRLAAGATTDTTRALVDAEARRLVGLGATHVRTDDDETDYYAVMQDPDGNEFCVG
jgi:catechol 2,3-dioxygenase-like lactoylglutathione lyase family enzyme